ncbi:hypothetical protein CDD83_7068 [Cordyceps sp. RAO-2017]|nr:hypothetical protein CDD83_7068 [Cordyceps sp. RAO-2017]
MRRRGQTKQNGEGQLKGSNASPPPSSTTPITSSDLRPPPRQRASSPVPLPCRLHVVEASSSFGRTPWPSTSPGRNRQRNGATDGVSPCLADRVLPWPAGPHDGGYTFGPDDPNRQSPSLLMAPSLPSLAFRLVVGAERSLGGSGLGRRPKGRPGLAASPRLSPAHTPPPPPAASRFHVLDRVEASHGAGQALGAKAVLLLCQTSSRPGSVMIPGRQRPKPTLL